MNRISTRGQQQRIVGVIFALVGPNTANAGIQFDHAAIEHQVDLVLAIPILGAKRDPIVLCISGKEILREVRTIARRIRIGADHREATSVSLAAQHLRSRQSCRASTDDHNRSWMLPGICFRRRLLNLVSNKYLIAAFLHLPAWNGIERRRAKCLSGTQAETGMVPRTTYFLAIEQTFGEWTVIVRTMCAHREELCSVPHQQNVFSRDDAEQLPAVGDAVDPDTFAEIRLVCGLHAFPPSAILSFQNVDA